MSNIGSKSPKFLRRKLLTSTSAVLVGLAATQSVTALATEKESRIAGGRPDGKAPGLLLRDTDKGAALLKAKLDGTGAVERSVYDKIFDQISVKDFGAVGDGVTDDTAAIQAAVDYAYSIYLGGGIGGKGANIFFPASVYVITSLIIKQGVSFVGEGANKTAFLVNGDTSTALKCSAKDTQLAADLVSYGEFRGFSIWSNEMNPTAQVMWDMTGFTRWKCSDVFFEWFNGCTAIECVGATLAGSGGPAQWYNQIDHCFFLHPGAKPSGGVALNLGDTDQMKEQVTALTMIGGRISSSGNGTGLSLRTTGCRFLGVAFEGNAVAVDVGSTGTRGASNNSFIGCYWEANVTNRQIQANAFGTQFSGSFVTGGVDNDLSVSTVFDDVGNYQGFAGNDGKQKWEVNVINGAVRRPKFVGGVPALGLENTSGIELIMANGATTSLNDKYCRFLTDGFKDNLFEFGNVQAMFKAHNLRLRNDPTMGWFTGSGSPEGVIAAKVGSLYTNIAGGHSTTLYVKETGSGNIGWVAK